MNIREIIEKRFAESLRESGTEAPTTFEDDMILLSSGLSSLGFAILVTRLELALGYDPFFLMTEPVYPKTFGEFVAIYDRFKDHAKE